MKKQRGGGNKKKESRAQERQKRERKKTVAASPEIEISQRLVSARVCDKWDGCVCVCVCTPVRETVRDGGDNEVRSVTAKRGRLEKVREEEAATAEETHTHTPLRSLVWAEPQLCSPSPPHSTPSPPTPPPPPRREMSPDSLHVLASKVREMSSMAKLLTLNHPPTRHRYAGVRTCARRSVCYICPPLRPVAVSKLVARQRMLEPGVTLVAFKPFRIVPLFVLPARC